MKRKIRFPFPKRLRQSPLTHVFHWDSVPRVLNPPTPFQGSDQAFVRTKAQGYRFAVLRPASDDALIKTLRAAFASSTYLLPQIHRPGRSSDDDLLIPLRLSEKSSRDLNTPYPLYKARSGFSILTDEYLTFQTVSPNNPDTQVVRLNPILSCLNLFCEHFCNS